MPPAPKHKQQIPDLRDGDIFPTHTADPDQVNPPYGIPDPARVAVSPVEHERWAPPGIKPTVHGFAYKDYAGRYLIPDPNTSLFTRLFGTNLAATSDAKLHPCLHATNQVHRCLDKHENKTEFCRSALNVMEGCFREFKW
jgi:hypothetical protein